MLCVLHLKGSQRIVNAKVSGCGELEKYSLTFDFSKVKLFHCRPLNIKVVMLSSHLLLFSDMPLPQYFSGNISTAVSFCCVFFLILYCCSCILLYVHIPLSRQMWACSVHDTNEVRGAQSDWNKFKRDPIHPTSQQGLLSWAWHHVIQLTSMLFNTMQTLGKPPF